MSAPFRILAVSLLGLALGNLAPDVSAQTDSAADELQLIRRLLETQSKQIEALTQQVTELRSQLDRMVPRAVAVRPSEVTEDTPPLAALPPPDHTSQPPASGPTHAVAAGETLTVIARRHNTTVAKLKELNNIQDERKLQIGQVLILPEPSLEQPPPSPQETP